MFILCSVNSISGVEFAAQNHFLVTVLHGLTNRRDEENKCSVQEG